MSLKEPGRFVPPPPLYLFGSLLPTDPTALWAPILLALKFMNCLLQRSPFHTKSAHMNQSLTTTIGVSYYCYISTRFSRSRDLKPSDLQLNRRWWLASLLFLPHLFQGVLIVSSMHMGQTPEQCGRRSKKLQRRQHSVNKWIGFANQSSPA